MLIMDSADRKMKLRELKVRYPSVPEHCLPILKRGKKQSPANKLTDEVIKHLKSIGGIGYRISSQGQFDPKQGRWRPSGQKKGLPDVIGILPNGRFIGIEIKIGWDKMNEYQLLRQKEITDSNGYYFIARDLYSFKSEMISCKEQEKSREYEQI